MFYELADSPSRQDVLQLKANLVQAKALVTQIQREKGNMTQAQVQSRYGFSGTQAQFDAVIDGAAAAASSAAVLQIISNVGAAK